MGHRLFFCGDVMTGRGIDQVLRHPCDPFLHEVYVESAADYVQLAETASGPIPRGVDPAYIWGAAMDEFMHMRPEARIARHDYRPPRVGACTRFRDERHSS